MASLAEHLKLKDIQERFFSGLNCFRIGEALDPLPEELLKQRPDVPWRKVREMRNLIADVYWSVHMAILRDTAQHHLPVLQDAADDLPSVLNERESPR